MSIDFTLHPKQVQPEHVVITSPYFRTDERSIDRPGGAYSPLNKSSVALITKMHEDGMSYADVGRHLGISRKRARYYYTTYKGGAMG